MTDRRGVLTIALLSCLVVARAWAAAGPLTRAETSDYSATSRYADVLAFVAELQRHSPDIRLETLAVSPEGRKIPLLVIGHPVPASPADLRFDDRAVVYFQANIHAGEVEGKEAALMLARALLSGRPDVLDRLVVLIAPIFNADGNEKIDPAHRPRQKGPVDGVGIRFNGANQDLNRDGMKLESPEVRGMVRNVLRRWDPIFFFDAHTHNGSYHQEPVTWVWGLNPLTDPAVLDYMENRAWPAIEKRMRREFGTLTIPHGDFLDPEAPQLGWVPLGPEPRYLSNYVGLRNRLAVLDEQYPYVDFRTRVEGAYHLMLSFLQLLHRDRDRIVRMLGDADRRTIERALHPGPADVFITRHTREALSRRVTVHGYEMEVESGGRYKKVHPKKALKTYAGLPYLARYTAGQAVPLPRAYLLGIADPRVIAKLQQHGIVLQRLTASVRLPVEVHTVHRMSGSEISMQGHYTSSVEATAAMEERAFPAGTYLVSMAQPLANVAAYLLEPMSNDGLVFWNYFDRYLAYQWYPRPREYPVYKLYDTEPLAAETVVTPD